MTNAAGSVDEKLGAQYGDYARSAAQSLPGFSQSLDAKDIDQLPDEARDFVCKSPAIAIGTAAAVGFVLARLVKSGFDTDRTEEHTSDLQSLMRLSYAIFFSIKTHTANQ